MVSVEASRLQWVIMMQVTLLSQTHSCPGGVSGQDSKLLSRLTPCFPHLEDRHRTVSSTEDGAKTQTGYVKLWLVPPPQWMGRVVGAEGEGTIAGGRVQYLLGQIGDRGPEGQGQGPPGAGSS